jgi:hypothetical protein
MAFHPLEDGTFREDRVSVPGVFCMMTVIVCQTVMNSKQPLKKLKVQNRTELDRGMNEFVSTHRTLKPWGAIPDR